MRDERRNAQGEGDEPARVSDDNGEQARVGRRQATLAINRRDFLFLGLAASSAAVGCDDRSLSGASGGSGSLGTGQTSQAAVIDHDVAIDYSFTAVRKDDFVVLTFDFVNMHPSLLHTSLTRINPGPAFVIVDFPPQHVFEAAIAEGEAPDAANALPTNPVGTRLSGASRVAFAIPDDVSNIVFTLDGLLQLISKLDLHVSKNALPAGFRSSVNGPLQIPPALAPLVARRGSIVGWILRLQRASLARRYFPGFNPNPVDPLVRVDAGAPEEPHNHETAIELPFRLLLSPHAGGAFAHASLPVPSQSGRVELWHSRLGVRNADGTIDEQDPTLRTVRAIWTRDPSFQVTTPTFDDHTHDDVFTAPEVEPLRGVHRKQIVELSSDFARYTTLPSTTDPDPLPRPIDTKLLMLSSLGGWLDVKGDWPDTDLSLEEWEHRATQGRDQYVKTVERGILYPFGHHAVLTTITERKFKGNPASATDDQHVAFLRQRKFIVVRELERTFTDGRDDASSGSDAQSLRKFPFVSLIARTLVTPNLDVAPGPTSGDAFVPKFNGIRQSDGTYVGSKPFLFQWDAVDVDGNLIRFAAPVSWIRIQTGTLPAPSDLALGASAYLTDLTDDDRTAALGGQRIGYADSVNPHDTTFETHTIQFEGVDGVANPAYPTFLPSFKEVRLALESVRHVAGQAQIVKKYQFYDGYVTSAFNAGNQGEILFATTEPPISVNFDQRRASSGGFISPSFYVQGISRHIGPVSNPTSLIGGGTPPAIASGQFDPAEFFGSLQAYLFGLFPLKDILDLGALAQIPKYVTQILTRAMSIIADAEKLLDDLTGASYPSSLEPLPSIQHLLDDLGIAFNPMSTDGDRAAATGRIPGRITTAVNGLANLPSGLTNPSVQIDSLAFRTDLVARAQSLANLLPGITSDLQQQIAALTSGAEFPKEVRTRLEWRGTVREFEGIFVPNKGKGPNKAAESLLLVADIRASAQAGGQAQIDLRCTLEDFSINLFSDTTAHFLTLDFEKIEFRVLSGKKPDISVDLAGIVFDGPLKFIETIKRLIPLKGFSDPPNISVDARGITAGFSLALPAVAVGVFSLENIALGAQLRIPFLTDPLSFSFNFSTRENPFNLSVALLGGGGFFGLTLNPSGIQMLEASLEAGARLSINLGIASGSVSAAIGVYFRMERVAGPPGGKDLQQVLLTGYFRIRGQLEVLGIITISAQLALELTYHFDSKKLVGRATLEVEIDILFFSASVTVTCERKFAGSNGDPTFLDIMRPEAGYTPWNDYLAAFA